ncbi:MAG: MAPEG family protein [Rickettsiales bacterium]|nr:MAPEG family protein [Rickettsiales bacterium]
MIVTSFYAAIFALIFVFLTVRVIKLRRLNHVAIGDNGIVILQRAIRAHGNFCESVPLALILLLLAESNAANILWLNFCAIILIIGRISHAYAISCESSKMIFRIAGMALTFTSIIFLALTNLILSIF